MGFSKPVDLSYLSGDLRAMAVPVGSLDPDPAKLHTADELAAIRQQLLDQGQSYPLLVRAEDMTVTRGNGTLQAARQLYWTHVAAAVGRGGKARGKAAAPRLGWAVQGGGFFQATPKLLDARARAVGKALGRKQTSHNDDFAFLAEHVELFVTRDQVEQAAMRAVDRVRRVCKGKRAAFGWSGGKDSIALAEVCRRAGVEECVFGMTNLEYPAFLQWVTDNMPPGLTVINTGLDLDWVAARPHLLFPQTGKDCSTWFANIQWKAQREYFRAHKPDLLLLGRRQKDGNMCGRPPGAPYTSEDGVTKCCPIFDWTHEQTIAFNYYNGLPCPPIYRWPNGFVAGTGPWPGRLFTGSVARGWMETYAIDPGLVELGATRFASAREFLQSVEG